MMEYYSEQEQQKKAAELQLPPEDSNLFNDDLSIRKRKQANQIDEISKEANDFLKQPVVKIPNLNKNLKRAYEKTFLDESKFEYIHILRKIRRKGGDDDSVSSHYGSDDESFDINEAIGKKKCPKKIKQKNFQRQSSNSEELKPKQKKQKQKKASSNKLIFKKQHKDKNKNRTQNKKNKLEKTSAHKSNFKKESLLKNQKKANAETQVKKQLIQVSKIQPQKIVEKRNLKKQDSIDSQQMDKKMEEQITKINSNIAIQKSNSVGQTKQINASQLIGNLQSGRRNEELMLKQEKMKTNVKGAEKDRVNKTQTDSSNSDSSSDTTSSDSSQSSSQSMKNIKKKKKSRIKIGRNDQSNSTFNDKKTSILKTLKKPLAQSISPIQQSKNKQMQILIRPSLPSNSSINCNQIAIRNNITSVLPKEILSHTLNSSNHILKPENISSPPINKPYQKQQSREEKKTLQKQIILPKTADLKITNIAEKKGPLRLQNNILAVTINKIVPKKVVQKDDNSIDTMAERKKQNYERVEQSTDGQRVHMKRDRNRERKIVRHRKVIVEQSSSSSSSDSEQIIQKRVIRRIVRPKNKPAKQNLKVKNIQQQQ